jgi:hypothetical protein
MVRSLFSRFHIQHSGLVEAGGLLCLMIYSKMFISYKNIRSDTKVRLLGLKLPKTIFGL